MFLSRLNEISLILQKMKISQNSIYALVARSPSFIRSKVKRGTRKMEKVSKHCVKSEVGDEPLLPTQLNLPVFCVQVGSNTVLPD